MKKQDQEKCDALAKEVILFLQKWGLWSDVSHLRAEMIDLFEKYGLWYDFCFSWSLTCYRI